MCVCVRAQTWIILEKKALKTYVSCVQKSILHGYAHKDIIRLSLWQALQTMRTVLQI